jgi:16S rRNA (cytidine1402-2'-O)-methyltransferase
MKIDALLSHIDQEPQNGVLYLVGTPIGNLYDISLRALNILKKVAFIACEDTRQTKKIMSKFEIKNNLISFNMHNSAKKTPKIITSLKKGQSIALVSDAGMPSICDPGESLVQEVKLNKLNIICIPGPCAATTALVSSGFHSSKFTFEGFLPKKKKEREKILMNISKNEKSSIVYESPHRINKLLTELRNYCGGNREIQLFRELTKKFEENLGNNIDEVIEKIKSKEVLGEITLIIKGLTDSRDNEFDLLFLKKELNELINAGLSLSAASKYLAKKNGLSKNIIYNLN